MHSAATPENDMTTSLTQTYLQLDQARKHLIFLDASYKTNRDAISARIAKLQTTINRNAAGLHLEKIALAETVLYATPYSKGGDDRASAIRDAITEVTLKGGGDLWTKFIGTKSYAHWYVQRSDHTYGYGPSHGSSILKIGLTRSARQRETRELSPTEIEAACYYLTNLVQIQDAREKAAA